MCPFIRQPAGAIGKPGGIANRLGNIGISPLLDAQHPQRHEAGLPRYSGHTAAIVGNRTNRSRHVRPMKGATGSQRIIARVVRIDIDAVAIVGVERITEVVEEFAFPS